MWAHAVAGAARANVENRRRFPGPPPLNSNRSQRRKLSGFLQLLSHSSLMPVQCPCGSHLRLACQFSNLTVPRSTSTAYPPTRTLVIFLPSRVGGLVPTRLLSVVAAHVNGAIDRNGPNSRRRAVGHSVITKRCNMQVIRLDDLAQFVF